MKIFVGNLSWDATDDALRQLFEAHGEVVSVRIVQDPYTGRSKGFGFVEMGNEAACTAAIEALNDIDFMGRPLRVSRALEQSDRPRSSGPRGGGDRGGDRGGGGRSDRGPRKPFRSREEAHYN